MNTQNKLKVGDKVKFIHTSYAEDEQPDKIVHINGYIVYCRKPNGDEYTAHITMLRLAKD